MKVLLTVVFSFSALVAQGTVLSRLQQGESLKIAAIGTSLTGSYYDPDLQQGQLSTWFPRTGDWLNTLYPGQVTLDNEAIGGAASKYTATYTYPGSGIEVQLPAALSHNPDAIFIEFAINDAYTPFGISQQDSTSNLQTMIDQINAWAASHSKTVDIVIQTMNNVINNDYGQHAALRPDLAAYYQGYREVAAANGLLLIDHYVNWLQVYDSEADHATWNSYVNGGVHPNDLGAEYVIVPEVQRALIAQTPEPGAIVLLATALSCLSAYAWQRRR